MEIPIQIGIIGAGNVANALAEAFGEAEEVQLVQLYNRTFSEASALASRFGAEPLQVLSQFRPDLDVYILAVADDAIPLVAAQLSLHLKHPLLVHTSGATPSSVLQPYSNRYGVFYPLQSFTKGVEVDMRTVPICLYASQKEDGLLLKKLGQTISDRVEVVDDAQRAALHVAAVFVNNFANACFAAGQQVVHQAGLDFELLRPLLENTAAKALREDPEQVQTGPAIRKDRQTLERHLAYLKTHFPEQWARLYEQLTQWIQGQLSEKE